MMDNHNDTLTQRIIGLTGNIACGKSTVLAMLRELGAVTVDADALAHAALAPDGLAYGEVVALWGDEILSPAGAIDRRRLGEIVFADPGELAKLEKIVHPLVVQEVKTLIASARAPLVIDAIKLIESGISRMCDEVWVVTCSREQQLERLMRRNHLGVEGALLRIDAQAPQAEKVAVADVVIDNSGTIEETRRQVLEAWGRFGS